MEANSPESNSFQFVICYFGMQKFSFLIIIFLKLNINSDQQYACESEW